MKFTTVKTADEILLNGIVADLKVIDGTVKGVTLTDNEGHKLVVEEHGFSISIQVPTPPKTIKGLRLFGTVFGLPVEEKFTSKQTSLASDRKRAFEEKAGDVANLKLEECELTEEEAETAEKPDEIPF